MSPEMHGASLSARHCSRCWRSSCQHTYPHPQNSPHPQKTPAVMEFAIWYQYRDREWGLFLKKKELGVWMPSLLLRAARHRPQADVTGSHRADQRFHWDPPCCPPTERKHRWCFTRLKDKPALLFLHLTEVKDELTFVLLASFPPKLMNFPWKQQTSINPSLGDRGGPSSTSD